MRKVKILVNGQSPGAVRDRKHVINLFTWPEASARRREELQRRGYNIIEWTDAGMTYWAVSDLNLAELREFVRLL